MKLKSFRITNFRSIIDSKYVPFSPDGVTAFVGQNESGKSSVLDALYFALSGELPSHDDLRIGSELPAVNLKFQVHSEELCENLADEFKLSEFDELAILDFLNQNTSEIEIVVSWHKDSNNNQNTIDRVVSMVSSGLDEILASFRDKEKYLISLSNTEEKMSADASEKTGPKKKDLDANSVALAAWQILPLGVRFSEDDGALPNTVHISPDGRPIGIGAKAAENFLKIAGINLSELIKQDIRTRENTMNRANSRVSADFRTFWTQTIGDGAHLSLKCAISNYSSRESDRSGKPHLVFWISDGNTQLYPAQRSRGTRWFISFYLQLKASEKEKTALVFLLDEPGSNLHAKAQTDVLRLINNLSKEKSIVIYSTHSSHLLEYSKLYRVHAVQRSTSEDDSPSTVINAHHLGTASSDTLSPVLSAMGIDFSHNNVIKKDNNVLLEEMSGYYYISSIWKITKQAKDIHLIAATGVNKIEALANMFRGWGLNFLVAVDDDPQGREAFKSMKKSLFGDDDDLARKNIIRFIDCKSIEDIFSPEDFKKYVLLDDQAEITKTNGEYLKSTGKSKPILAFQFNLLVKNRGLELENFDVITQEKMLRLVNQIEPLLLPL